MSTPTISALEKRMRSIKHKIVVLSGKGGVGKSSVSTQLAWTLSQNYRVGILDIDICGPSVPKILGIDKRQVFQCSEGWVPVYVNPTHNEKTTSTLCCMSIAFLLQSEDDAVVWRGPKKHAMIRQFMEDVYWGDLDVLIIDTPPGTSDEHISLAEMFKDIPLDGAILVTTPQGVSINDVKKELNFCRKLHLPVIGIVENMSGYACPCCHEITYIFGQGGGQDLAQTANIPFLGTVPIDPKLGNCEDEGIDFIKTYPTSTAASKLKEISDKVTSQINLTSSS